MAMYCQQLVAELCAYLDGEGPAAWADFEAHLVACRKCRLLVETCRRTVALYRQQPLPPLPAAVHSRVMTALRHGRGAS